MPKSTQDKLSECTEVLWHTFLFGAAESGKTTFIRQLIQQQTSLSQQKPYTKTIGVDFATYKISTQNVQFIDLLFDCGSDVDLKASHMQKCLKQTTGFILFLDATNAESLNYLETIYNYIQSQDAYNQLPMTVVATKVDLPNKSKKILRSISTFASQKALPCHMISTLDQSQVKRTYRAHIKQSLDKYIPQQTLDNSFTSFISGLSLSAKQALFDSIYNEYKPFFQRHRKPLYCSSIISGVTGLSLIGLSLANHYLHYKTIATVTSTMTLHTVSLLPIGGIVLLCAAIILACYAQRAHNDIENTSSQASPPLGAH